MSAPGGRILGSYRLEERVGKGGMGEVYRAEHTRLGSERAVKVLPPVLAAEPDFLKRFEREASSAAKLDHPNILPVYEYGEADGVPYLVMPYVKGGTLKERLARGAIGRDELVSYFRQMAEALDYAHQQGLVHRDVKPANMLLDGRGRLYLADFGIAKALEGAEGLTRTGVGVGTPEYMAPEQAQGRADARSDLYALGVILYQLLTGRVPYSGNSTVEVLMKHLQDPLPLLPLRTVMPSLSPQVEQVVAKALAKNPDERYQSGKELVDALEGALRASPAPGGEATILDGGAATMIDPRSSQIGNQATGGGMPPPFDRTPPPVDNSRTVATGGPVNFGGGGNAGSQFGGNQPPYTIPPVAPPPGPPPSGGRGRGLLFGGLAAVVVLLLICGGGGVFLATRPDTSATQTAQAGARSTVLAIAAVNLAATQTASAPTVTPTLAPTATATVAPTSTIAPTATIAPPTATKPAATSTTAPPTPTKAATIAPTPTRPAAAAPTPAPLGTVPTGWKIYRGTSPVPFVIAYPPDWRVDTSSIANGQVYFRPSGPDSTTWMLVATEGQPDPSANIDVLRDNYYNSITSCTKKAIDRTNTVSYSGITFAGLGLTCDTSNGLLYERIGVGLNKQVPWRYRLNAPYGQYSDLLDSAYSDMLTSLNIYANP